jgi:hypothetical protein
MTTFPGAPRTQNAGLVLIDPQSAAIQRVIVLQYNPDMLTRSIQAQTLAGDVGDRLEALRFKAPAIETIKLEAEIDATDQLEFPDQNPNALNYGILPQLAALEMMLYPASADVQQSNSLAAQGTIEIAALEGMLTLFVWTQNRVVPVRVNEFSVTEEMFDPTLNPIRAKVTIGMRVLSSWDLGPSHKGASIFMAYHQSKEALVSKAPTGDRSAIGAARKLA